MLESLKLIPWDQKNLGLAYFYNPSNYFCLQL